MPSLGFASTAAATAIDQAVKTALDTPRFKHSQFPYGRWPAFTIAIRQGTRLVFSKAYGFSDWGADPVLAHADDRMRLASDSKQLTGAAIYKLIHDGQIIPGLGTKLTLQTSVFQVLSSAPNAILPPGGKSAIVPDLMNVTVEDLLHQFGGGGRRVAVVGDGRVGHAAFSGSRWRDGGGVVRRAASLRRWRRSRSARQSRCR